MPFFANLPLLRPHNLYHPLHKSTRLAKSQAASTNKRSTKPCSVEVLSATYRTLDVTASVRAEIATSTNASFLPGRAGEEAAAICVDPWTVTPWWDPALQHAPHPAILTVVWRLRLADGTFSAPTTSSSEPGGEVVITPRDVAEAERRLQQAPFHVELAGTLWVVSAWYFHRGEERGRDVTSKIAAAVERALKVEEGHGAVVPMRKALGLACWFGTSSSSGNRGRSQLCITYRVRLKDGRFEFRSAAAAEGEEVCIDLRGSQLYWGCMAGKEEKTSVLQGSKRVVEGMDEARMPGLVVT